eukprot:400182-Pelagomonas_calceolata.AAC.2
MQAAVRAVLTMERPYKGFKHTSTCSFKLSKPHSHSVQEPPCLPLYKYSLKAMSPPTGGKL